MGVSPDAQVQMHRDLIFDVGMNTGQDTDFYLKKGFRVVAFEANPALVNQCRRRFAPFLTSGQLTIVPGAIVEDARIGKVTLHCDLAQDGRSSIYPSAQVRWGEPSSCTKQIEVETVDFGACLARYGVPYYLKSDIEGADLVCLRALAGFAARPCYVSIESSVSSLDAVAGEMDLLEGLGYHAFQAVQQQSTCHTRPPRPAREGRDVEHRFEFASSGLFGRELPERWVTRDRVLGQYRRIHRRYRVYQKVALWRRSRLLQRTVAVAGGAVHLVYAGWYDTHARHASVCSSRG